MTGPPRVRICEVSPRDGLQHEAASLPLQAKVKLVTLLAAANPWRIEATSFVRADRIPQLADADELAAALGATVSRGGVQLGGLVPNLRGFERLRRSGFEFLTFVLSATESHNRANLNRSVARSLEDARQVMPAARAAGVAVRASISMAFGCPFENSVPPERVLELARALAELGAGEILLSDTLGVAQPLQVRRLCERALADLGPKPVGLHMHDTYGAALANVLAGWEAGVADFDAAAGGTGGCPYAPGAAGNLAAEDLVALFQRMGVETGMDLRAIVRAARFLEGALGHTLPGRTLRAIAGP